MSGETERLTFTIDQTATTLGIGRSLAYQMAKDGSLPGVIRCGRRLLVSRPALLRFLEAQEPAEDQEAQSSLVQLGKDGG